MFMERSGLSWPKKTVWMNDMEMMIKINGFIPQRKLEKRGFNAWSVIELGQTSNFLAERY